MARPEVGHRFLVAAHKTFALLATQPDMGWDIRLKHIGLKTLRLFRVTGVERILVLYLPMPNGVEILRVVHGSRDVQALLYHEGLECVTSAALRLPVRAAIIPCETS